MGVRNPQERGTLGWNGATLGRNCIWCNWWNSLFGHIVRFTVTHQLITCYQQVMAARSGSYPNPSWHRRPGRPRYSWIQKITDGTHFDIRAKWCLRLAVVDIPGCHNGSLLSVWPDDHDAYDGPVENTSTLHVLVRALSAHLDQHPGMLYPLHFVVQH